MFQGDPAALLPANSWSSLVQLNIALSQFSKAILSAFLIAAPGLQQANLTDLSGKMCPALMLAMVLSHCPQVVALCIYHSRLAVASCKPVSLNAARHAFDQYPIHKPSSLKHLGMPNLRAKPDAFDYLMVHLDQAAPNLIMMNAHTASFTSPLHTYSTRHLRSLQRLGNIETVAGQFISSVELLPTPLFSSPYEMSEEDLLRATSVSDWHILSLAPEDGMHELVYGVFRRSVDEQGRTGRQLFYDQLKRSNEAAAAQSPQTVQKWTHKY